MNLAAQRENAAQPSAVMALEKQRRGKKIPNWILSGNLSVKQHKC